MKVTIDDGYYTISTDDGYVVLSEQEIAELLDGYLVDTIKEDVGDGDVKTLDDLIEKTRFMAQWVGEHYVHPKCIDNGVAGEVPIGTLIVVDFHRGK